MQNPNVGALPPSDSESDSEEEAAPREKKKEARPAVPDEGPRRRKEDEVDAEQMRIDMERLEMVRVKREQQRLQRIQDEGWDRYAPVTDTNHPPDGLPVGEK